MTEEEWLNAASSWRMLNNVQELFGRQKKYWWDRKYRLFGCACFRAVWELLPDEVLHSAVVVAEKYTDGLCDKSDLDEARRAIIQQSHWLKSVYVECCLQLLLRTARKTAESGLRACHWEKVNCALSTEDLKRERREQEARLARLHCEIIRDIFGNPFRLVAFPTHWRTSTAVAIARQMYELRDFSAVPILADALQDGGCDNEDVLTHCRDVNAIHVRGCWVVDAVLGKS